MGLRSRATIAATFCALIASGCYRSHERGRDAEPPPPRESPGQVEALLARAWCEAMADCVRSGASLFALDEPLARIDVERCVESGAIHDHVRRMAGPWDESLARGDARLEPEAIPGCLDAIAEARCLVEVAEPSGVSTGFSTTAPFGLGQPGLLGFDERCEAMYVRDRGAPAGAACAGPLDCAPGTFCDRVVRDGACAQECVPYDDEGAPCERLLAAAGSCRGPRLRCQAGRCVRQRASFEALEDEPCGALRDGGATWDERCAPGLSCVFVHSEDALRCVRATAGEGEPCRTVDGPWCEPPLLCLRESGSTEQRCGMLELAGEAGARCDTHTYLLAPTPVCDPRAGLACAGERCEPRSSGLLGARCDARREPCEPPLVCSSGRCAAPLPEGAACRGGDACEEGICDRERGVCVRCG